MNLNFKAWARPKPYVACSAIISTGGLLFGFDTGSIGAIVVMPQFYTAFGEISPTVHGLVVSSILIPAAISSFFAGSLADYVGRPRGISIGAIIFALGSALEAGSNSLAMLFAGRIIAGAGQGLYFSTILVYICEIAPARERGGLASIQQFLTALGICVGYFICYGSVRVGSTFSWRLPFALQSFIAIVYTGCTLFMLPESPRWLSSKGRQVEASQVWDELGVSGAEREKVEEETIPAPEQTVHRDPEASQVPSSNRNTGPRKDNGLLRVFAKDVRTRTLLAVFLSGFQQLSGIDGVLYYAPLLFHQAGLSTNTASLLASGISALLMLLITLPATLYADAWNRRTSTLLGGAFLSTTMLTIGALYATGSVHPAAGAGRWAVIVLIYVFALAYCSTWAVTVRIHTSEIQPLRTRAAATGLAQTANSAMNWIVAFTTPIFLARSAFGAYFFFGACTLLATGVCAAAMPETKGRSLEEIDLAFEERGRGPPVGSVMERLGQVLSKAGRRAGSEVSEHSGIELRAL